MGVSFVLSPCYLCGWLVSYNPTLVPSIEREPICKTCLAGAVLTRRRRRLPIVEWYHPDAYGMTDDETGATTAFQGETALSIVQPPPSCAWCMRPLDGVSCGTYFTTQVICQECKDIEPFLPGYAAALAAENAQVEQQNFLYEGVGLSDRDKQAIAYWVALQQGIGNVREVSVTLHSHKVDVMAELVGDNFAVVFDPRDSKWAPFHRQTGLNACWFSSEIRARGAARALQTLPVDWSWTVSGSPEWRTATAAAKAVITIHRESDELKTTPLEAFHD
jgi:hypothetical protein